MQINEKLVRENFKIIAGRDVQFIVLHDTGNTSRGADANAHQKFFSTYQGRSAHYFVDDTQVLRIIKDEHVAWHVGDGKGLKGVTNTNSIGIEMCINAGYNRTKMKKNTMDLVLHLMKAHSVPIQNVIRHYDASGKRCPGTMSANNWKEWHEFKAELNELLNPKDVAGMVKIDYKGKTMLIPGVMEDGKNYVAVRDLLEAMGYKVGWDAVKKVVLVK